MTMTRAEAIERLAICDLGKLSAGERAAQLETMTLEDWSDSPGWGDLPRDVREEFTLREEPDDGNIARDPTSPRYDAVVLLWLRIRYVGATNSYLRDCLAKSDFGVTDVAGPEEERLPCPCCGRATLSEHGAYDICKVCWWEDDGQDNATADAVMGGPNYGVSLTQGRVNFLRNGISDPTRGDLRLHQDPAEKYAIVRVFLLSANGDHVMEPDRKWISRAFTR
jgi:hypothetical protein